MQLTDQHLHDAGTALTRVLTTIGVHPLEAQPNSAFRLISQSIAFNPGQGDTQGEIAALEIAARAAADPDARDRITRFYAGRPMVQHLLDLAAASIPDDPAAIRAEMNGHPPWPRPAKGKPDLFEPISEADLHKLCQYLNPAHDPLDAMFHPQLEQLDGLSAAVFAEASWATGTRPAEWPSAAIEVEQDSRRQNVHLVFKRAMEADPPPPLVNDRPGFLAHSRTLLSRILTSGPVWLKLRTAKSDFLAKAGLPLTRSIGLHYAPLRTKIATTAAVYLANRHAKPGPAAWRSAQRRMNSRLKSAAEELLPDRTRPLTLYEFRHAFLDRCKALLTRSEIAALAGHSSPRTKQHYGRPQHQTGRSAVLPAHACPDEVAIFEAHLARKPGKPAPKPAEPTSSPAPSPAPRPGGM